MGRPKLTDEEREARRIAYNLKRRRTADGKRGRPRKHIDIEDDDRFDVCAVVKYLKMYDVEKNDFTYALFQCPHRRKFLKYMLKTMRELEINPNDVVKLLSENLKNEK